MLDRMCSNVWLQTSENVLILECFLLFPLKFLVFLVVPHLIISPFFPRCFWFTILCLFLQLYNYKYSFLNRKNLLFYFDPFFLFFWNRAANTLRSRSILFNMIYLVLAAARTSVSFCCYHSPVTLLRYFSHEKNPYQILGVTRETDISKIKATYIELAKRYHPDTQQGNTIQFQQLTSAIHAILSERKERLPEHHGQASEENILNTYDPAFIFEFIRDSVNDTSLHQELHDVASNCAMGGPDRGGWYYMAHMIAGTSTGKEQSQPQSKAGGLVKQVSDDN